VPAPEKLTRSDACDIADRWGIDERLTRALVASAFLFWMETRRDVEIISGARTVESQNALRARGRPTADNDRSTHLTCPATGADVRLGFAPTRVHKAIWGRIIVFNGLRWGGGSPVDSGGIPSDWAHADLGPRPTSGHGPEVS